MDAASQPNPAGGSAPPRPIDVWSHATPKYRIRAAVLLSLTFVLYCGLCVFTYWLHSARLLHFSLSSYLAPFRFWGEQSVSLNTFLTDPIDVTLTPIHAVVLGLLVASMVATPIAVAILYRFPTSLPFAAAVLIFAHMPWMAVTLVGSCVLASVRPFRLSFRFGAALVGLLPILLYLMLATRGPADLAETLTAPEARPLLITPWVVALLAASVELALILSLASIVNYRPGVAAPVLALMIIPPTLLFHTRVGTDELAYRVLERRFGPRSPAFSPVTDVEREIAARMQQYIRSRRVPRGVLSEIWSGGDIAPLLREGMRSFMLDLLELRYMADANWTKFVNDHPYSRYIPCALYMQAHALDARLDEQALRGARRRELYFDFPHPQSRQAWSALWSEHPESPLAIEAAVRLAQLHVREGAVDEALRRLELAIDPNTAQPRELAALAPSPARGLWEPAPPEASLMLDAAPLLEQAQQFYELIQRNRDDDPNVGDAPLCELAQLDPRRVGYKAQLLRLAARYPDSKLYDNIVVRWAEAFIDKRVRIERLSACLAAFPDGDARGRALFRLADLEVQSRNDDGSVNALDYQSGLRHMRTLVAQEPDSIWGRRAADRLRLLEPQQSPPARTPQESP